MLGDMIEEIRKLNRHLDNMRSIFYNANLDKTLPELVAALIDLSKEVKRLNHNIELLLKKIDIIENVCHLLEREKRVRI